MSTKLAFLFVMLPVLSACACSGCGQQNAQAVTSKNYRVIGDIELKKRLIGNNISLVIERKGYGNDGTDIFPDGHALVLIEGTIRAKYTIQNHEFCIETFGVTQCSYFITNGRRIFQVQEGPPLAVSALDICPIRYPGKPQGECNVRFPP